ncbi:MAG TPA: sterol desaturase family protein [Phycisphaerae bacterium]
MDRLLLLFRDMPPLTAALWLLIENVLLFFLSLTLGHVLLFLFARRRVVDIPEPLQWQEVAWASLCVLLNTLVTLAGWFLWRGGIIVILPGISWRTLLDVIVLLLAMDLLMYISHRLAHLPFIYPWVHHTHHRYDKPRPLNLFVLNPFEVLGFGALWLAVIVVYHSTWTGMLIYLALNLLFGTIGHLGVEPFPKSWTSWPLIRHISTSTFHARHHQDRNVNFGFYTDLWDRLFRSLYRQYERTFGQIDCNIIRPVVPSHSPAPSVNPRVP